MNADNSSLPAFYFTFAFNSNLRNNYIKINAASYNEAREMMIASRGLCWAFQYDQYDFQKQIAAYGLTEVSLHAELIKF